MIKNISLKEIGKKLQDAQSILLFPHENADGDAIGSCVALCLSLREMGKDAFVLVGEEPADFISFITGDCCIGDGSKINNPDICMCVDCGEEKRISGREDKYYSGKIRLTLDHHVTEAGFGDFFYVDENAAATGELVYELLKEMGAEITVPVAEALYVAISTDTGNFKYSNTSPKTHIIAAELMEAGVDHNRIMVELYQNVDIRQLKIRSAAFARAEIFAGGKGAITCVTRRMLEEAGARQEHAETVIDSIRDISGVEIAAVLKERDDNKIKVSLRAKSCGKVNDIAGKFGGGGHVKAAGCTVDMEISEAAEKIKAAITESLALLFGGNE